MKNSKNSVLKFGKRKPYDPISRVIDLPPALLEVQTLIERGLAGDTESLQKAATLQESIITTALENPTCVQQIRNLISNGYEFEISYVQADENNFNLSEEVFPTPS